MNPVLPFSPGAECALAGCAVQADASAQGRPRPVNAAYLYLRRPRAPQRAGSNACPAQKTAPAHGRVSQATHDAHAHAHAHVHVCACAPNRIHRCARGVGTVPPMRLSSATTTSERKKSVLAWGCRQLCRGTLRAPPVCSRAGAVLFGLPRQAEPWVDARQGPYLHDVRHDGQEAALGPPIGTELFCGEAKTAQQ